MEFKINKSSEFPIYQQLKEQIKFYLLSGALQPGSQVPTPKDLGLYLQINRNTVIAAYKELEQEGLLMTKQGQGTYIADKLPASTNQDNQSLLNLAQEMIERTQKLGFSPEDLFTVVFNKTILGLEAPGVTGHLKRPKALMIECNQPDLEHYCDVLKTELNIEIEGCLLDELTDTSSEGKFKDSDFVVTHVTHLEDVKAFFEPFQKNVFGLMAAPYFETFIKIKALPVGARVGIVCLTKAYTVKMKKAIEDAEIHHISLENCGIDDMEAFNQMVGRIDYLVSSRAVVDSVRRLVPKGIGIIEYAPELDKAGIQMLKKFIAEQFHIHD
jgi:DNA-binding transcriptional regulator YhcF (GntR family)